MLPAASILAGALLSAATIYKGQSGPLQQQAIATDVAQKSPVVLSESETLPIIWGDLGARLVASGTIDGARFKTLYGADEKDLTMTKDNAGLILNLFWALGLGNKNAILDSGEMADRRYGGAGNFASTGGWTLAQGDPMDHYSMHMFIDLTPEEQALVDKVSRGIYRPCCNNSTHFPDCNHGMAMLGLLELMASQGASESVMWRTALAVNSFWFPDAYEAIAGYMQTKGIEWKTVDPQQALSAGYSSASGLARVMAETTGSGSSQGSSCSA